MKIVVTGAKGMLGTDFCRYLKNNQIIPIEWDLPKIDLTDANRTIQRINEIKPDVICHFAAYTDVDGSETNKGQAYAVNTQGSWAVALGARDVQAKLLYISTDYIFDGRQNKPYLENDKPNPINYYGQTKFLGEKVIVQYVKKFFIVRTAWLYGKNGKNFITTILKLALEKETFEVVNDQVGSPTYTKDLCEPLLKLLNSEHYGMYHITNSGSCSWFDLANAIINETGLKNRVLATTSDKIIRPAKRPTYSVLENHNYRKVFKESLRSWNEALKDFLKEIQT